MVYTPTMREVRVTAAVLIEDGRLLAARRPAGVARGGLWELPGGKLEPGETLQQCLARELGEELGIEVEVERPFETLVHDYPDLRVELNAFFCRRLTPALRPTEHDRVRWLGADELDALPWSGADLPLVARLKPLLR